MTAWQLRPTSESVIIFFLYCIIGGAIWLIWIIAWLVCCLELIGAYWSLLELIGANWSLLSGLLSGTCWSLLELTGAYWSFWSLLEITVWSLLELTGDVSFLLLLYVQMFHNLLLCPCRYFTSSCCSMLQIFHHTFLQVDILHPALFYVVYNSLSALCCRQLPSILPYVVDIYIFYSFLLQKLWISLLLQKFWVSLLLQKIWTSSLLQTLWIFSLLQTFYLCPVGCGTLYFLCRLYNLYSFCRLQRLILPL